MKSVHYIKATLHNELYSRIRISKFVKFIFYYIVLLD